MEWFAEWWNTLEGIEQVLYCVAIPATLILLIQVIMIFFGFGHDGAGVNPSDTSGLDSVDFDIDTGGDISDISADASDITDVDTEINYGDGSSPGDFGVMNFFTMQGIITFCCVFSWSGIAIYGGTGNAVIAIICGIVLGLAAMYGVAKLLWVSKKLAQNGTLNVKNLLGATGTVYLVIPASGEGKGKVSVTSGERLVEFDAITDDGEKLPDGTPVRVIDVRSGNVLVVEKA